MKKISRNMILTLVFITISVSILAQSKIKVRKSEDGNWITHLSFYNSDGQLIKTRNLHELNPYENLNLPEREAPFPLFGTKVYDVSSPVQRKKLDLIFKNTYGGDTAYMDLLTSSIGVSINDGFAVAYFNLFVKEASTGADVDHIASGSYFVMDSLGNIITSKLHQHGRLGSVYITANGKYLMYAYNTSPSVMSSTEDIKIINLLTGEEVYDMSTGPIAGSAQYNGIITYRISKGGGVIS